MAYITKEEVKAKAVKLKALAKKYGIKLTVAGSNSSTIRVNIASGSIDFIGNFTDLTSQNPRGHIDVNHYHMDKHFDGIALQCLEDIKSILKEDHFDHSDIQTDYFNVAWYMDINIGQWNKPYQFTA